MKRKIFAIIAVVLFTATSCNRNAITGRNQLSLVSEDQVQQMAKQEYRQFLSQSVVVNTKVSKDAEMVI